MRTPRAEQQHCPRCGVSAPAERRRCVHCGGRLERGRRLPGRSGTVPALPSEGEVVVRSADEAPDALAAPGGEEVEETEVDPRVVRMRRVLAAVWVVLALIPALWRACS